MTHTITVHRDRLWPDLYVAACSCGWTRDDPTTKLSAMGAGDRHVAAHLS